MEQKQVLLPVFSVILVGIAIVIGITMFQSEAVQIKADEMITDLLNLGSNDFDCRVKPASVNYAGNSYSGFQIYFDDLSLNTKTNINAIYICTVEQKRLC